MTANHLTSVIEIREAGILMAARGKHVIRVLGALRAAPFPGLTGAKEDLKPRASASAYADYHSGALSGPQQDPETKRFHPRVPSLFITRKGDPLFLRRDPAGEVRSEAEEA